MTSRTLGLTLTPTRVTAWGGGEENPAERADRTCVGSAGAVATLASLLAGWPADPVHDVIVDVGALLEGLLGGATPALTPVTALRIAPVRRTIQLPFSSWPSPLRERMDGGWVHVPGGADLYGHVARLDPTTATGRAIAQAQARGASAICVSAVGGLVDATPEFVCAEQVARQVDGVRVILAHQVGGRRFLERERAALLHGALQPAAEQLLDEIEALLAARFERFGLLRADGSRTSFEEGRLFPANLLGTRMAALGQGAARVTGLRDAFVLIWSPDRVRVLTVEDGLLRTRWQRSLSVLGPQPFVQRHPSHSSIPTDAGVGLTRDLVRDQAVLLVPLTALNEEDESTLRAYEREVLVPVGGEIVRACPDQVAAAGAAAALPQSEVVQYAVVGSAREQEEVREHIRRLAQGRVLASAGLDVDLETVSEYCAPISFLSTGPVLVRTHVVGRPAPGQGS